MVERPPPEGGLRFNLPKGLPAHLQKAIEKEAKKLIKEGTILSKSTGYGLEVSLKPRMKKEIEWIIREGEIR